MKNLMLLFLWIQFLTMGCGEPSGRNIKDYYYPALEMQKGTVYGYIMSSNGASIQDYWYYTGFVRDSGLYLSSTNYNNRFEIEQIVLERLADDGSVAKKYTLYEQDTTTGKAIALPAHLASPDIFPFQVPDTNSVYLFSVDYRPLSDTASKLYLIRNRRFLGDGPDFVLNNKHYATIKMGVREAIGNEQEGASEIMGQGEEWYAKGLGLVYYKKVYGEKMQIVREYRLNEIIAMKDLEQRFSKHE